MNLSSFLTCNLSLFPSMSLILSQLPSFALTFVSGRTLHGAWTRVSTSSPAHPLPHDRLVPMITVEFSLLKHILENTWRITAELPRDRKLVRQFHDSRFLLSPCPKCPIHTSTMGAEAECGYPLCLGVPDSSTGPQ